MRIAHAADLHIGYAAYQRIAAGGVNVRESDVGSTLTRLVDAMIAVAPDAVVIAGDVFHSARPSNHAIVLAFAQFSRLSLALPKSPIVIAAGNHDLSKTVAGGSILQLLTSIRGVYVADRAAMRFAFPAIAMSVLAVPDAPDLRRPVLAPCDARYNVLCLHGDAQGVKQGGAERRQSATEISRDELNAQAWDYIALGHYHQYEEIAPNAFYSGSIDYTNSNPWQEIGAPKGFVVRDLRTGEHTFHEVTPSRAFIELAPIYAAGLTPAAIDAEIAGRIEACAGFDDAVVRLIVHDIERDVARALDQKAIRTFKSRALNFNVDWRRPAPVQKVGDSPRPDVRRRASVYERWDEKLGTREIAADVDRAELIAKGRHYLELAEAKAPADEPTSIERQLADSLTLPLEKSA